MSAKIPKNIRFRKDQIDGLEELEDAETDFSALVRKAVDDLLAKRRSGRVQETPPLYGRMRRARRAAEKFNKTKKAQATRKRAA